MMHPMTLYRKIRDEHTLTNTEYFLLRKHEAELPRPKDGPGLSKNPFMNRCGMEVLDGVAIGESGRLLFDKKIDDCRRDFISMLAERLIEGPFVLGASFYSDDAVFQAIRSSAEIEEYFANPYGWLMDGLRASATQDHEAFQKGVTPW